MLDLSIRTIYKIKFTFNKTIQFIKKIIVNIQNKTTIHFKKIKIKNSLKKKKEEVRKMLV